MKLTIHLITILMVLGLYTSLQGAAACRDGQARCNDGTIVNWSCVYRFPGCQARDFDSSKEAAEILCEKHDGPVNIPWFDPTTDPKNYRPCLYGVWE